MKYNPQKHQRRSIRLKGYDYSQPGSYFVTICCQDRIHQFGRIEDKKMILNDAGQMIEKWYFKLENKFPDIQCHAMIIMPNHFHCIIEIKDYEQSDPNFCPPIASANCSNIGDQIFGEHINSPLYRVVQWFKTMTTNEYIRGVNNLDWRPFNKRLWQRNYWEHIIRNETSFDRISQYIIDNPSNWKQDKLHEP